jgi:hypothetical protein
VSRRLRAHADRELHTGGAPDCAMRYRLRVPWSCRVHSVFAIALGCIGVVGCASAVRPADASEAGSRPDASSTDLVGLGDAESIDVATDVIATDGVACDLVPQLGNQVALNCVIGTPSMTGGVIVDGVYIQNEYTLYQPGTICVDGMSTPTEAQTWRFAHGRFAVAVTILTGTPVEVQWAGSYTTSGSVLMVRATCGESAASEYVYSASGTQLTLCHDFGGTIYSCATLVRQ